jgi:ribosomal protein S27AE
MSLRVEIARLGLKLIFHSKYKFVITYDQFDRKRKEPFFLISNHASLNDPLYVGMNIKYYPYPVASNILYTHPVMKFALNHIVKSIPKRKGQSDIQTIRLILNAFQKDKRGIMIFPEGNSSFFGEQTPTDFMATAKIVKKIKHDLVMAKINGGFFSSPRWGLKRKRPQFHIHYYVLHSKEEFEHMSLDEIAKSMEEAISYNDYEWNREKKIKYKSSKKAIGLEQYIYACPKCGEIQTIKTHKNDISCDYCGKLAHFNDYHYLEGLPFDNLIEWDHIQKNILKKQPLNRVFQSSGLFYLIDLIKGKRIPLGKVNVSLNKDQLILTNTSIQKPLDVSKIYGITLTQKNVLSFDYEDESYMIKIKDPMLIMDRIKMLKGDL